MLTDDELARWRRDGVLVVSDAIGADERRALPNWAEAVETWTPRSGDSHPLIHRRANGLVVATENVADHHDAIGALARRGPISEIATVLLGETVVLHQDLIRFGSGPASMAPVARQLVGRAKYIDRHLGCVVAIDAMDVGDLEVAIGFHRRTLAMDRHGNIDRMMVTTLPWTSVVLAAGDALFLHRRAPHRSIGDRAIRTLELTYSARAQGDLRAAHYVLRRRQALGLVDEKSTTRGAGDGASTKGR